MEWKGGSFGKEWKGSVQKGKQRFGARKERMKVKTITLTDSIQSPVFLTGASSLESTLSFPNRC